MVLVINKKILHVSANLKCSSVPDLRYVLDASLFQSRNLIKINLLVSGTLCLIWGSTCPEEHPRHYYGQPCSTAERLAEPEVCILLPWTGDQAKSLSLAIEIPVFLVRPAEAQFLVRPAEPNRPTTTTREKPLTASSNQKPPVKITTTPALHNNNH